MTSSLVLWRTASHSPRAHNRGGIGGVGGGGAPARPASPALHRMVSPRAMSPTGQATPPSSFIDFDIQQSDEGSQELAESGGLKPAVQDQSVISLVATGGSRGGGTRGPSPGVTFAEPLYQTRLDGAAVSPPAAPLSGTNASGSWAQRGRAHLDRLHTPLPVPSYAVVLGCFTGLLGIVVFVLLLATQFEGGERSCSLLLAAGSAVAGPKSLVLTDGEGWREGVGGGGG